MSGERLTPNEAWNEGFDAGFKTGLRKLAYQLKQDLDKGFEIDENKINDAVDIILELNI